MQQPDGVLIFMTKFFFLFKSINSYNDALIYRATGNSYMELFAYS